MSDKIAIAVAAVVLLGGCPTPKVERPYAAPTAAELVRAIRARQQRIKSLRTDAKVDYFEGKGERVKLSMSFLVAGPDKLRIDAESPIGGNEVATLVSDGDKFALLDVQNNQFLVGPARPCNIARLIRVYLAPAEVDAVLEGGAPLLGEPIAVGWNPGDGGREVLTLKTPDGGTETVQLDATDRRWDVVSAEVKDAGGKTLYKLAHEDFAAVGGERFPGKTHVEEPPRSVDLRIRYKERELDPKVPDGVFTLQPPSGLPVREVNCGG